MVEFEKIIIDILTILASLFVLILIFILIQVMIVIKRIDRAIKKFQSITESIDTNYIKIIKIVSKLLKI
jgi:hypothetical protein